MGAHSAELYNNLGLCCLYSQQLDLTIPCFQRGLDLATDPPIRAEVWYNLSHLAVVSMWIYKFIVVSTNEEYIWVTLQNKQN